MLPVVTALISLSFGVSVIALCVSSPIGGVCPSDGESKVSILSYSPHDPISIEGDAGFTNLSGVVRGSGTEADPFIIEGWQINASTAVGISIELAEVHFIVRSNYVHDGGLGGFDGIAVSYCGNATVENNMCMNNSAGVSTRFSDSVRCFNNTCVGIGNYEVGIMIDHSNGSVVLGNNCSSNLIGAWVSESSGCWIQGNTLTRNHENGMYVSESHDCILRDNSFERTGLVLMGWDSLLSFTSHDIDSSNTVNGKPLVYAANAIGLDIDGGAGQVIMVNCSGSVVQNQKCDDVDLGVFVAYSANITVSNNSCSWGERNGLLFTWPGIYIDSCSDILVTGNSCIDDDYGLLISGSENCLLTRNNCSGSPNVGIAIQLLSRNVTIANNLCYDNNGSGIEIYGTGNMTIIDNTCVRNGAGAHLIDTEFNHVSGNTMLDNEVGVMIDYNSDNNTVSNNSFYDNENGIGIRSGSYTFTQSSQDNLVTGNLIVNSTSYGVKIAAYSVRNRVWNNSFYYNNGAGDIYNSSHIQAYDDGTDNWWNSSGSPHGYGNFWRDWTGPDGDHNGIVEFPYDIDGYTGSKDWYPLAEPAVEIPEFPTTSMTVIALLVILLSGILICGRQAASLRRQ